MKKYSPILVLDSNICHFCKCINSFYDIILSVIIELIFIYCHFVTFCGLLWLSERVALSWYKYFIANDIWFSVQNAP